MPQAKPPLRIGVCYDFRNPPDSGTSDQQLYAEVMEQVQWLDQIGADLVWFTEHHFINNFGITDIVSMAVPPGMRSAQMKPSLERLFTEVVPKLKALHG